MMLDDPDMEMLTDAVDGHHTGSPAEPAAAHRDPSDGYSAAAAVRGAAEPSRHVRPAQAPAPAPPPQLSRLECANAARNCAENFGEQQAREWLEHRCCRAHTHTHLVS